MSRTMVFQFGDCLPLEIEYETDEDAELILDSLEKGMNSILTKPGDIFAQPTIADKG